MGAKYIIRLDDACPGMDHEKWGRCEDLLGKFNISPIVAVVPDNKDPKLNIDPHMEDFWDKVKAWKHKQWEIALHGYQHLYETQNGGLVPINQQSEFAGLPYDTQRRKIANGWKVFKERGITPNTWVAPSHSFDENTLKALKAETSIQVVSDGISTRLFSWHGFTWIPQQLWRFRLMPFGIYTICLHPNTMTDGEFDRLRQALETHHHRFVSIKQISLKSAQKGVWETVCELAFFTALSLKRKWRRVG